MEKLANLSAKAPNHIDKEATKAKFLELQSELFDLQNLLYANGKHSLLIILQGLDAAGKDSTIRNVFSCVNPTGCNVKSFKKPTEEEQMYGFLWRIYNHLPAKGMIQIFNRSHYEDILVPTVHKTHTPLEVESRYDYINAFENQQVQQGTPILKFFLNVSEEIQLEKLAARKTDPRKKWKYDKADETEKKHRPKYIETYDNIFEYCGPKIPWEIIPSDQKWYRNYSIISSVVNTLKSLDMTYPK